MLTRTLITGLALGLAAAGCGGSKGSSTTTSSPTSATPVATPTPVPITVAMTLSVAAPSTTSDVTITPKAGLHTKLNVNVMASGGSVTLSGQCQPQGFDFFNGSLNLTPGGPVTPGSPFTDSFDLAFFAPQPPPSTIGSIDCSVTGMTERGDSVTATKSIDLPSGATSPFLDPCVPDATTICAFDRFRVQTTFQSGSDPAGPAMVQQRYSDGGYFYFFDPSNWELLVQALNRCGADNHYWILLSGQTNVGVNVTVTDTQTGLTQIYTNPPGTPFTPITDTSAFASCP